MREQSPLGRLPVARRGRGECFRNLLQADLGLAPPLADGSASCRRKQSPILLRVTARSQPQKGIALPIVMEPDDPDGDRLKDFARHRRRLPPEGPQPGTSGRSAGRRDRRGVAKPAARTTWPARSDSKTWNGRSESTLIALSTSGSHEIHSPVQRLRKRRHATRASTVSILPPPGGCVNSREATVPQLAKGGGSASRPPDPPFRKSAVKR